MPIQALSVSQLNSYIRRILSMDPILGDVTVSGEISNFNLHSSGHLYFSLKDDKSRINCFLPRDRAGLLRFVPGDGMQVIVTGYLSVYERGGSYSLNIIHMDPEGEGAFHQAFEAMKGKLEAEGLFDPGHKRPIPAFPGRIALVTSPTGAAVRDMITTIQRRNPLVSLRVYPALVQGEEAAASICAALAACQEPDQAMDLIILGRGGGSVEDLWVFNEEALARAVFACQLPVISAVGHERDVVLTDFVADLRAATPTAAAELAVGDLTDRMKALADFSPTETLQELEGRLSWEKKRLEQLAASANEEMDQLLDLRAAKLDLLALQYELTHPLNILKKGFSAIKDEEGGWITKAAQLQTGSTIRLLMEGGWARCRVEEVELDDEKAKRYPAF